MQVSRKQNLAPNILKHAQQSMLRSKHEQQPYLSNDKCFYVATIQKKEDMKSHNK